MGDAQSGRRQTDTHELLHTPAEERFDRITRLAQHALSIPIAAIMLLNEGKQWFKSITGWTVTELPEERAVCSWAFEGDGPTIINDMERDARTADHPFVRSAPNLRFFAAYPLVDQQGWPIGGFCVSDVKPRILTSAEQQALLDLAELAQRELARGAAPSHDSSLATTFGNARREGTIDPLTRLWNRRGAYVLLRTTFDKADQRDASLGIAIIDIDDFKQVNSRHGHQTGDEVLRKVGTRIVSAVRGRDIVFRLVDDRFLLVFADVQQATAESALERVRWAVSATSIPTRSGEVPISLSAGVTMRAPHDPMTVERWLTKADVVLKLARDTGKGRRLATSF